MVLIKLMYNHCFESGDGAEHQAPKMVNIFGVSSRGILQGGIPGIIQMEQMTSLGEMH